MPRPNPLVALHGAVDFNRFIPFDAEPSAPPLAINDLLVMRRAAGGPNLLVSIGDVQTHGGSVNIADLLGGANDDMLYRVAGIWTGTGSTGLKYNGTVLSLPDGTVALPSLAFTSEPTTGIFNDAATRLGVAVVGFEVLNVVNTGVNGRQLIILPGAIQNQDAGPALSFGDGDTGFFESADDVLEVAIATQSQWRFSTTIFQGFVAGSPALNNQASSNTNPGVRPAGNDSDTGIGHAATDQLSLIAGGVEAVRLAEASGQILQTNNAHVGLTASTTQTQAGGLTLLSSYNEIATVANVDDTVVAPTVAEGKRVLIINNGANRLQVFPAVGDDIGAGLNTAITIAAGSIGKFIGQTAVLWDRLFNGPSSIVANDAVQAIRTTTLTLLTAFVDVTLNVTDVESNANVIEHDNVNTDDIDIKEPGLYEIAYEFDIDFVSGTGDMIFGEGRVRLNDAGTGIVGSLAHCGAFEDTSIDGDEFDNHLSCKFIVNLIAGDFVTLQVRKFNFDVDSPWEAARISFQVVRLK